MKKGKKALLTLACAGCLIVGSVFGTFAYLTDSKTVMNTFTVGQVGLTLEETGMTDIDNDGVFGNAYHLIPGQSYIKDPTVTVTAESEASYVRMIVTVEFENELTDTTLATNLDNIFTGYDETKWIRNTKNISADNKTITYEYRYHTTVAGGENGTELESLFEGFTIPETYTNEQISFLEGMTIKVEAHAIQAAGFADEDKAWTAFKK